MLKNYHARYNNVTYLAVQTSVLTDLYGADFARNLIALELLLAQDRPNTIMNTLTDAAIEIAEGQTTDKVQRLINLCHWHYLSPQTIRLMSYHLENFENHGAVQSADFENAALSLSDIVAARPTVLNAVSVASAIHNHRGRTAHHLLKAAAALLHTAELLLLNESSAEYIQEKLSLGQQALADAVNELSLK